MHSSYPKGTYVSEAELIASAQQGDASALNELFTSYAPAMRAVARRFSARLSLDDATQAAAVGLMNAIHAFDASRPSGAVSLSVLAHRYMNEEMWVAVSAEGLIQVPARTLRRYFHVMRQAGNDLQRAVELAQSYDMRRETFLAVAAAISPAVHESEAVDVPSASRFSCVEDQILSSAALAACSEAERAVLGLHYGMDEPVMMPLSEVAVQLSLSQRAARRLHASGLAAAREAVGAA